MSDSDSSKPRVPPPERSGEYRGPERDDDPFPDTAPTAVGPKCDSWENRVAELGQARLGAGDLQDVDIFNLEGEVSTLSGELGTIAELWMIEADPLFRFGHEPEPELLDKACAVVDHLRAHALAKWQEVEDGSSAKLRQPDTDKPVIDCGHLGLTPGQEQILEVIIEVGAFSETRAITGGELVERGAAGSFASLDSQWSRLRSTVNPKGKLEILPSASGEKGLFYSKCPIRLSKPSPNRRP